MRIGRKSRLFRTAAGLMAVVMLASCASTTVIRSRPDGAIVYLDGIRKGPAPVRHSDMAPLGTTKQVRLELEGYRPLNTTIRKDELKIGPLIGGLLVMVPFIWVLGYPPEYEFALEPLPADAPAAPRRP